MKHFKKLLPVLIGIGTVLLTAIIIVVISVATNRTPKITNGKDNYLTYGDLNVTKQDIYDALKMDYSVSEITRLIDLYLFKDEINKVNDEDLVKYVEKTIYGEDFEGDKQKEWDDVVDSLILTGVISKADAKAEPAYDAYNGKVWAAVKDYYRLPLAKENWAKERILANQKELQEENGWEKLFDEDEIEEYFEDNFGQVTTGLYIPFTSQDAAYAMMEKYGINTNNLSNGWVKNSYDANAKLNPNVSDFLTPYEVVETFIAMYNEVLNYYTGSAIITSDNYTTAYNEAKTLYLAQRYLNEAMAKIDTTNSETISGNVQLPLSITVNGKDAVSITWDAVDTDIFKLNVETGLLTVTRGTTSKTEEFKATIKLGEETREVKYNIKATSSSSTAAELVTVSVNAIDPVNEHAFDLNNEMANGYAQFIWEITDTSDFAKYLGANSTELELTGDAADFNDSYTLTPVAVGNYYCLMIKFSETAELKLEDEVDNVVAKMTEDLYNSNNYEKEYYEYRIENNFKIYDKFIEAIYEYSYNTFYGTTLGLKEYDELKLSKKTKTKIVASVDGYEITPDELYDILETKYGAIYVKSFIDQYVVINSDFNTTYNPWKDIKDKAYLKSLLKSDINSFKQNFELDYFTYEYLASYGFIPNFPASYGWKDFLNDYYLVEDEIDLLISQNFGGKIYSDSLTAYTESLYAYDDLVKAMDEAAKETYDVDVMNLIVSVDYNYDGTADTKIVESNKEDTTEENWSANQIALVEELSAVIFARLDEVLAVGTMAEKLTEMVNVYNNSSYTVVDDPFTADLEDAFGKYKLAGLYIKFESTNNYKHSSSLVQEFHDAMYQIYSYAANNELVFDSKVAEEDTNYTNPIVDPIKYTVVDGKYAFASSYGYHVVAVEKANSIVDRPTEDEIKLYVAANNLTTAKDSYATAKENLASATGNEVAVASYKEQIKQLEKEIEKYEAQVTELTTKLGLDGINEEDDTYTLDADIKEKCEYWYTAAKSEVEQYLIETYIINLIKDNMSQITFAEGFDKTQFDFYLEYLLENYSEE